MSMMQLLAALNALPVWKRHVSVWGRDLTAITLDRLVNLYLHRAGLMGSDERELFGKHIHTGMTVVDVGANQALYTLLFSELAGPSGTVYAFEPDPDLYACASNNCTQNRAGNVKLFSCALGSREATLTLGRPHINSGDNRLAPVGTMTKATQVAVKRLDAVLAGVEIDFVKIDVQGWEFEVLRGMEGALAYNRPMKVYLEFWPQGMNNAGDNPVDLLKALRGHGFSISAADGERLNTDADFAEFTSRYRGHKYTNILAER